MAETVAVFVAKALVKIGVSAVKAGMIAEAAKAAVVLAIKIGVSYGVNAALTPRTPSTNTGRTIPSQGGVVPHAVVYGRQMLAGHHVAEHGWAKKGAKLKFYTALYVLAGHELDGLEQWYVDGKPATADASGFVTAAPWRAKGYNFLQLFHARGRRDEPVHEGYRNATRPRNPSSGNINPSAPPWWRDSDRLRGRAWHAFIGEYDEAAFPGGAFPQVTSVWRGKRIYDPRLDSTAGGDGPQRADDPQTWAWSDNWALVCADYWRSEWGPMRDEAAGYPGRVMPARYVDWMSVIRAANASDELVPDGWGGTEKRWRLWVYFPDNINPRGNFDLLIRNGAGWYTEDGGRLKLWAGVFHPPAAGAPSVAEDWATGDITVDRLSSVLSRFNGARGEWIDPGQAWRAVSYPELTDPAALARDKGVLRFQPLNFIYAPSAGQALRAASINIRRTLFPRVARLPTDRLALLLQPGETYVTDMPGLRLPRITTRLTQWEFEYGGDEPDKAGLVLEEEDPSIYALPDVILNQALSGAPRPPGAGDPRSNLVIGPDPLEGPLVVHASATANDLSWPRSDLAGAAYEIWTKAGAPPLTPDRLLTDGILLALTTSPAWRHAGLKAGETWTYAVRPIDTAGLPGPFTPLVTVTL